ncbi:DUF1254 domain-containing protein, partial [Kitasatospora sp. NPDC058263]
MTTSQTSGPRDEREAQAIAVEAYVYLYPLVMMDATRRQMTNAEAGEQVGFGPMNTFSHMRTLPPVEFKAVPWPSFDTLYSPAWLDLTEEPLIVSVPDAAGRYYLLPLQDMWTDVFAVPGKRTTGTQAGDFAVVPPGWLGELPSGVGRIDAPTPYVWVIGRTQTNGPQDYAAVNQVQDGFTITALSRWGREPQPVTVTVDPTVDMTTPPVDQVNQMSAAAYFTHAIALMKLHPPHITDWSILARMRRIGIDPGRSFDMETLDPAIKQALNRAVAAGQQAMRAKVPTMGRSANGWQVNADTMGVYGNYYLKRATLAMVGLGSNPPEDAIYPLTFADADGQPLTGENDYVLHFDRQELPPVEAFWSVTVYDQDGFQVANPLNRCALGDRDALRYNADGSLDLLVQHESPGPEHEANWLPAPRGPLALFMRLYEPRAEVLDGRWAPPA